MNGLLVAIGVIAGCMLAAAAAFAAAMAETEDA